MTPATRAFLFLGALFVAIPVTIVLAGMGIELYCQLTGTVWEESASKSDAFERAEAILIEKLQRTDTISFHRMGHRVREDSTGHFVVEGLFMRMPQVRHGYEPVPYLVELQYRGPATADPANWTLLGLTIDGVSR
ncbi:hypothetical protein Q5H93_19765 [Hymenobacter sp. ASUV-10]|uniref:Uncharacterized protein n=1 Tax=Hymenobacter aranciens TaxID=3063996 RepID=A0ABT9BFE0_9BACT|nr:hypothetical protein [Hymenobacter sp. ASUV-10]MDO7876993.1 hypothetical protein [Hymenobacter sp. ASUV-10]